MIEDKNIPHVLNQARPSLSADEKASLWSAVEVSIPPAQPVLSPYSFTILFKQKYIMAPIALLLAVILGGGATAYASDAAKPGDTLYPVERLVESMQLGLTFSPEAKEELVEILTQERLAELREIIAEEVTISPGNAQGSVATSTALDDVAVLSDLEIEARVFLDTTVVKLELGGKKFYFETDVQTESEIRDEVLVRFPMLSELLLESVDGGAFLTFQVAGRESRPNDRGIVSLSEEGKDRINVAVDALLAFLDSTEVNEGLKDVVVSSLTSEVDGTTPTVEAIRDENELRISDENDRVVITIDDEGNSSIEVHSKGSRVKVEDTDGEIRIEKKKEHNKDDDDNNNDNDNDNDDDDDDNDNNDNDNDNDDDQDQSEDKDLRQSAETATSSIAVSATIFTDTTVVVVVLGVAEFTFITDVTTVDGIVSEVQAQFPSLNVDDVKSVLTIGSINQASTPSDRGEVGVTESDDDEEEQHEDEDREEDDRYEGEEDNNDYRYDDKDKDKDEDEDEDEDNDDDDEKDDDEREDED